MAKDIQAYISKLLEGDRKICELLTAEIDRNLSDKNLSSAESKVWHAHPVWFLEGNPIVGYSKEKRGVRLMFWSGQGFDEEKLSVRGEKFKDASIFYNEIPEVNVGDLARWLQKAQKIQWDYKNIVKRKGELVKLS